MTAALAHSRWHGQWTFSNWQAAYIHDPDAARSTSRPVLDATLPAQRAGTWKVFCAGPPAGAFVFQPWNAAPTSAAVLNSRRVAEPLVDRRTRPRDNSCERRSPQVRAHLSTPRPPATRRTALKAHDHVTPALNRMGSLTSPARPLCPADREGRDLRSIISCWRHCRRDRRSSFLRRSSA